MGYKLQNNLSKFYTPVEPSKLHHDLLKERSKSKTRHDSKLQNPKYTEKFMPEN